MSFVSKADMESDILPPDYAKLTFFVCDPYRRQGIGTLALLTRLETVALQFGGRSWIAVNRHNSVAAKMVIDKGFKTFAGIDSDIVFTISQFD